MELTHASFFSGVGGTDLGLERAGWRTVSFSEIDPYACAVLAERWPGVPNVGDIVDLADGRVFGEELRHSGSAPDVREQGDNDGRNGAIPIAWQGLADAAYLKGRDYARFVRRPWHEATLWSGGFPCQDLSVAGKRRGFAGERSVLAFAFLALVERHRPPAILLENVPGLLSSHGGRDMAALCGRMVELGYGVAYRVLDAQHFGVPQRRRRVFILGLRSDPDDVDGRVAAERAAAVLSVGARCGRHPATGHQAGAGVADGAVPGVDIARAVTGTTWKRHDEDTDTLVASETGRGWWTPGVNALRADGGGLTGLPLVSTPPDANGVRAADGLAGRAHDSESVVVSAVRASDGQSRRPRAPGDGADHYIKASGVSDDPLLPLGLDSHRYRCCGNGVVAPVAEWLGWRLREALERAA